MSRISLSAPDVGPLEREYLLRALEGGWIAPAGPDIVAFERDLTEVTGCSGAVALASGTAALHLALLAMGVGPGDRVLTSSFTFVATANAIMYCGAEPVFLDSDPDTWNMSPQLLAEELTDARRHNRLPKAVVVVDLYGQCADYDELLPQCKEFGIKVVEDAAESLGSTYKGRPAGALADVGVFSFNGNKIVTTSGGGMFVSPEVAIAEKVRYLATQAREREVHYEHRAVGFNYRMSNLLAALGRAQLHRLPQMSARRLEINAFYRSMLGDIAGLYFMPTMDCAHWNGWLTCIYFDNGPIRDRVQMELARKNIESRPLWKPMHLQPVYLGRDARINGTSEMLFNRGLCLPSGSALSDEQVELVGTLVLRAISE